MHFNYFIYSYHSFYIHSLSYDLGDASHIFLQGILFMVSFVWVSTAVTIVSTSEMFQTVLCSMRVYCWVLLKK